MKRPLIVTSTLLGLLTFLSAPGCNTAAEPDDGNESGGGRGNAPSAGSGNLVLPTAGNASAAAGTANQTPTPTAGTGSGGEAAGTAGSGGAPGTAGSGGAAPTAGTSSAGSGPGTPGCPTKIDSQVACTMVATCNDAYCGVFQLGAKDCTCAAASGNFTCTSCDYTGKTEEIVLPPSAPLAACASDDTTLEKSTPGCTKGMRCKSLTADKNRFCACWDDPIDGGTKWDCDAQPSSWPK